MQNSPISNPKCLKESDRLENIQKLENPKGKMHTYTELAKEFGLTEVAIRQTWTERHEIKRRTARMSDAAARQWYRAASRAVFHAFEKGNTQVAFSHQTARA